MWQIRKLVPGEARLTPGPPVGVMDYQNASPDPYSTAPFCISLLLFRKQAHPRVPWKVESWGPWRIPRVEMTSSDPGWLSWNLSHTLIHYGQWDDAKNSTSHNYEDKHRLNPRYPYGALYSLSKSTPFLSMSCSLQPLQPPLPLGLHNKNPNKLPFWLFPWMAARGPHIVWDTITWLSTAFSPGILKCHNYHNRKGWG